MEDRPDVIVTASAFRGNRVHDHPVLLPIRFLCRKDQMVSYSIIPAEIRKAQCVCHDGDRQKNLRDPPSKFCIAN